ncbi:MAG: ATP-dependent helicase [Candidatus Absconditicoccaceae bacterium]
MNLKDYIASNLNEEQTLAALHTKTSSLIIAGAGSGKTRVLTYKIAYLIRGLQLPVQRILAVTFTNKAANEMKERLIKLGDEILSQNFDQGKQQEKADSDNLSDFLSEMQNSSKIQKGLEARELKWIGTFHSIFLKILKEDIEALGRKFTKNFGILDSDDSSKIIRDLLKRFALSDTFKPQEVKGFISTQKNNGNTAELFLKHTNGNYEASMGKLYQEYEKELEKANSLDFDDLLLLPYLLFKQDEKILKKWQNAFDYILVDEAQDTNWIQFELMKLISGTGANITLIGDDFQSIYGWRGALMENFLNVKQYRPDIQMFKLQTNYRSKPHIVNAGNAVIKQNKNQYEKNIVAHREGNDKITIFNHNTDIDEAANTVELIKQMKAKEKLKSRGQVAILYRTNAQSGNFETMFIQEGIPYKIFGAFKFFERKEIKDILAYLKVINNPFDTVSLKRVLNIPNRKIGKTSEERLEDYANSLGVSLYEVLAMLAQLSDTKTIEQETGIKLMNPAFEGIKNFIQTFEALTTALKTLNPADFIELILKKTDYKNYLIKEEGNDQAAEEKYENVGQLINMASKYEFGASNANQEVVSSGEELLRRFLEEVTLMVDTIENKDENTDAVKLMTVHSSKGLEFPVVFIVGAEDSVFPLANAMLEPKLLEEERRLMYVAITRAKDVLFISHAQSRMTWGQTKMNPESRFLSELPSELIKHYDLTQGSSRAVQSSIAEGATVRHKLFGTGYVLEIWNNMGIVKFHNPKFGLRKVELRFLEEC